MNDLYMRYMNIQEVLSYFSSLVLQFSLRDCNLFFTEFILIWAIMILNGFLFLSCLIPTILSQKKDCE